MKTLVLANKEMMNIHEIKARLSGTLPGGDGGKKAPVEGAEIDDDGNLLTDSKSLSKMVSQMIRKTSLGNDLPPEKKKKKKLKNGSKNKAE